MRRTSLTILFLAISLGTTSCNYFFHTRATGSLQDGVEFRFYDSSEAEESLAYRVYSVTVSEVTADRELATIWFVNGREHLNVLEYGSRQDGFQELLPAKPLVVGKQYVVSVSGSRWIKPGLGRGGANFYFDENGRLVEGWMY